MNLGRALSFGNKSSRKEKKAEAAADAEREGGCLMLLDVSVDAMTEGTSTAPKLTCLRVGNIAFTRVAAVGLSSRASPHTTIMPPLDQLRALAKQNNLLQPLLALEEEADAREDQIDEMRMQVKQLELAAKEAVASAAAGTSRTRRPTWG